MVRDPILFRASLMFTDLPLDVTQVVGEILSSPPMTVKGLISKFKTYLKDNAQRRKDFMQVAKVKPASSRPVQIPSMHTYTHAYFFALLVCVS